MRKVFSLNLIALTFIVFVSCQTTETIVASNYKIDQNHTSVYSAKTFFFKNYTFTFKEGKATLVYQQDNAIKKNSPKIYLDLRENKQAAKYQEFTDKSNKIIVRVINDYEVILQLDKTRHTLYAPGYKNQIEQDTNRILADIAIWRNIED